MFEKRSNIDIMSLDENLSDIPDCSLTNIKDHITEVIEDLQLKIKEALLSIRADREAVKTLRANASKVEAELRSRNPTIASIVEALIKIHDQKMFSDGNTSQHYSDLAKFDRAGLVIRIPFSECNPKVNLEIYKWAVEFCVENLEFRPGHSSEFMYIKLELPQTFATRTRSILKNME